MEIFFKAQLSMDIINYPTKPLRVSYGQIGMLFAKSNYHYWDLASPYTKPALTNNLIYVIFSFCSETNFILKIDDDVHMNYEYLVEVLSEKYNQSDLPENVVECPSPLRNKKPFRPRVSGSNTVLGKWSVSFIVTFTSHLWMMIL